MDGLTVLVEAKKEYLAQLCCVMCPHMITTFENLYKESNSISKGKKILAQYQLLLKEVPNWNNHIFISTVKSCQVHVLGLMTCWQLYLLVMSRFYHQ